MLDWFRSWHGAPTDPKWLVIAKRANVSPGVVSAVVWALLDHASQTENRGEVVGFDFETYATFSGFDEDKVRAVYAALEAKEIIVSGRIAQWERRQPKREDNSVERVRALRSKKEQPELPLKAEAPQVEEPPPSPAPEISVAPSPTESAQLITPEAFALADEVAVAVGHDLKFVPPAWCGAASRAQMWLTAGWSPQLVLHSVRAQMQRKRDGPPDTIKYFEKGIARAIAEQVSPLPTVIPFPAETVQARHGKPQSAITAAVDRIIADLETGGGQVREDSARLLPDRRRE